MSDTKPPQDLDDWLAMAKQTQEREAHVNGPVREMDYLIRSMSMTEIRALNSTVTMRLSEVEARHKKELAVFDRLRTALKFASDLNGP